MLTTESYNPDVLTCLANLSSDEVFTPPTLANQMLDLLPQELWSDPNARFLDPACKSGVFLREIARRLDEGLKGQIPDRQERINHILRNQLYGIAITELTALISRRSLYCSKTANGKYSVCDSFGKNDQGNILFQRVEHSWKDGRCAFCGTRQSGSSSLDRGTELETHAYTFIHSEKPEELFDMQFDVIIGNPPYQLEDEGFGNSASPIYHRFVEQAMKLQPRFLTMIIPARWFSGGKGLDDFRDRMLKEPRLRNLVDYPKLYDGFPGVKIRGGVCYFLWDRDYSGPCTVQTMWDGEPLGPPVARPLNAYDVLVRRNEAVSILDKVLTFRADGASESLLIQKVSSDKPFGLRTYVHGSESPEGLKDPIRLYGSQRVTWIDRSEIEKNAEWIDAWKVLTGRLQGTSSAVETMFLSRPIVSGPREACTESYLVVGPFAERSEAESLAAYLKTRFVRFLVSLRKSTQHASRDVYSFVPDVPLDQEWTDEKLYKKYGLTQDEIAFIESMVRPMEPNGDERNPNRLEE